MAERKIPLVRLAHVYYTHKDFDKANRFLADFGFQEAKRSADRIYYRGSGTEPFVYCAISGDEDRFDGAAFVVESAEDLEYAAQTLPGATPVHRLGDEPGGGNRVTFYDPVDGFPFHLVHGQSPRDSDADPHDELQFNYPKVKNRGVNQYQRFKKGPAPVHKLGHFGAAVTDFDKTFEFYTTRFNFKPSELIHDDSGKDINTFLHLDRGSELVDHHCFFFFQGPEYHVHHSSYETYDFDTQLLGHNHLKEQGWENCWGVGRHVMGSQIFDYWYDPSRFILEHYVDGDLVDETAPINRTKASPDGIHVWGPDLPEAFVR